MCVTSTPATHELLADALWGWTLLRARSSRADGFIRLGSWREACDRMSQSEATKKELVSQTRLNRFHHRLVTMCVVETTAASQSGMSSWKTEPCRLLLRILSRLGSRT